MCVKHLPGVFVIGLANSAFLPDAANKFNSQVIIRRLSRSPPDEGESREVDMEVDALYL